MLENIIEKFRLILKKKIKRKGELGDGSTRKELIMKVKCIIDEYFDRKIGKYVKKNDILDMNEDRARYLIQNGFVEETKQNKETKDTK